MLGITPVADTIKSHPYTLPLVSLTKTGHECLSIEISVVLLVLGVAIVLVSIEGFTEAGLTEVVLVSIDELIVVVLTEVVLVSIKGLVEIEVVLVSVGGFIEVVVVFSCGFSSVSVNPLEHISSGVNNISISQLYSTCTCL